MSPITAHPLDPFADGLFRLLSYAPAGRGQLTTVLLLTLGLVCLLAWRLLNPDRGRYGVHTRVTLTPDPRRKKRTMTTGFPFTVPLDEIPRDAKNRTPYDALGPAALHAAVEQFYSAVVSDPRLAELFVGVNLPRLKQHQARFLGQILGGPVSFNLEYLRTAHRRLPISSEQYWLTAGHLMVVLDRLQVPDWIVLFIQARLYQVRGFIIDASATEPAARPAS